jgi:hypothetical protein
MTAWTEVVSMIDGKYQVLQGCVRTKFSKLDEGCQKGCIRWGSPHEKDEDASIERRSTYYDDLTVCYER